MQRGLTQDDLAGLAEIDRLKATLHRASPSLSTRSALLRARTLVAEVERWSLQPGQLVIVDEASMAGTFELDALTEQARSAGAKVLLVGDWAQLSPVSATEPAPSALRRVAHSSPPR